MYTYNNYNFRRVSQEDVKDFLTWKYGGIYTLFDNDFSQGKINYIKTFPDNENVFSIVNDNNELVGNCALYFNDAVTFSIQLRPSLTSKGMGKKFTEAFLQFAKNKYNLNEITLSVIDFNERAIRLYKSLGFEVTRTYIGKTVNGEAEFIEMKRAL